MGKPIRRALNAALLASSCALTVVAPVLVTANTPGASDVYVVQQFDGRPSISVGGTVIPYKEVTLAAQLPGRVRYLAGIEGDRFDEGDLLVAIDDAELQAKREALLAQMSSAEAQLRNAGVQYNREIYSPRSRSAPGGMGIPNLFDQFFTEQMEDFTGERDREAELSADLFASSTQIQEARNAIRQLEAELRALDSKLRDARAIAPFDGVVVEKFIEVGDTIQPGQPMLRYADVEYLQVAVDVPARLRPGLREGMMLSAKLDVPVRNALPGGGILEEVPVRVAQIFPMADPQRHTIKVKFDLPQGVSEPGMYAEVLVPDFAAQQRSLPVIPESAVRYNGSLPGVYVLDTDNKPQLRLVRLGEPVGSGGLVVLSGLRVGERILRNPDAAMTRSWSETGSGQ